MLHWGGSLNNKDYLCPHKHSSILNMLLSSLLHVGVDLELGVNSEGIECLANWFYHYKSSARPFWYLQSPVTSLKLLKKIQGFIWSGATSLSWVFALHCCYFIFHIVKEQNMLAFLITISDCGCHGWEKKSAILLHEGSLGGLSQSRLHIGLMAKEIIGLEGIYLFREI